jgi:hypothetical protein
MQGTMESIQLVVLFNESWTLQFRYGGLGEMALDSPVSAGVDQPLRIHRLSPVI